MSNEEVIKRIRGEYCFGCIVNKQKCNELCHISVAIEALEKQIPKRPIYSGDGYSNGIIVYDYAECPVCGKDFENGLYDWGCDWCSDCGQKLDWSDE